MSDTEFDVVVIGGGPGGYVAAIRAAQLGMKTAVVEGRGTLGGTCLNVGCIPSKALLHASESYHAATTTMEELGVVAKGVSFDVAKMLKYKNKTVKGLTGGIEFLMKKNKIEYVKGWGSFTDRNTVKVATADGGELVLATKNVIIATGSEPSSIPGVDIDEDRIVSSTGALDFTEVPEHILVIGGGVIGLELGSVWGRLGSKITVVEFLDTIVPGMDADVQSEFAKILTKQGMDIRTSTKVTGVKMTKKKITATIEPAAGGDSETIDCDRVLVSVGRRPFTEGLGLETIGVETNPQGMVVTDDHWRTNVEGVYAIGDVIAGPMLAHKAEEEGSNCADVIAGNVGHVNYDAIPGVVYTQPEIATVGKTEEQLKEAGVDYKAGKFPFMANAKAKVGQHPEGFIKVLADAKTDRILGVHIIGADAGNLIAEAVLAMEFDGSAEDIALTTHAHPTLSETLKEAALAVACREIHV